MPKYDNSRRTSVKVLSYKTPVAQETSGVASVTYADNRDFQGLHFSVSTDKNYATATVKVELEESDTEAGTFTAVDAANVHYATKADGSIIDTIDPADGAGERELKVVYLGEKAFVRVKTTTTGTYPAASSLGVVAVLTHPIYIK